jgi:prepilin-type processing-associated H-X9-DG protein
MGGGGVVGNGWDTWAGLLTNRSRVTLGQATGSDGTSNTLLFGEALGGKRRGGADDHSLAWMGAGALVTGWGLVELQSTTNPGLIYFSSLHPGGVNFCFGDGSVRTLRRGISTGQVFVPLSGYKDGRLVSDFE